MLLFGALKEPSNHFVHQVKLIGHLGGDLELSDHHKIAADQIKQMPVVHQFYKLLAQLDIHSEYQLRILALGMQYLMILKPIQTLIHNVYKRGTIGNDKQKDHANRSPIYMNLLCLLVMSSPCIYD